MEDEVYCSTEEQQTRIAICKQCDSFAFDEQKLTYCKDCSCSISLMVSFRFKECPKGNW